MSSHHAATLRLAVTQEALAAGLAIVNRGVSTRSSLPVLGNVLLSADGADGLQLAATNLELSVQCWLGSLVEEVGAITLPARLLTDWVNALPEERIDLAVTRRTMTANLKCARFESNIKGIDADEFPLSPSVTAPGQAQVAAPVLQRAIERVAFAAADPNETGRPALTSVLLALVGARLTLATTDGYRLAVCHVALDTPATADVAVLIPARTLREVARISAGCDADAPVALVVTEGNQIALRMTGIAPLQRIELISQLVDAKFPDYTALVPKSYGTRVTCDTTALLRALKTAMLFAREAENRVYYRITPGTEMAPGQIALQAAALTGDQVSTLAAQVEGPGLEVAFNGKYLAEGLAVFGASQTVLELTQPNRPGVLYPVGEEETFKYVLMPMELRKKVE